MSTKYLRLCTWAGPAFVVLLFGGYVAAGFFPPPEPSLDAQQITGVYAHDPILMKFGLIIMMFGLALLVPFMAAVATQMKRMSNSSPVLVSIFLIASAATVALLYIMLCAWAVCAFRPQRTPQIVQAFNDFGFIMLIWPVSLIPMTYISLGLAILADQDTNPIFPRWFAFANFWMALLAYGGAFLIFFQHGPFAWNGLIGFWVAAVAFFGWYISTSVLMLRSLGREYATSKDTSGA